jgi:hypothetical protein
LFVLDCALRFLQRLYNTVQHDWLALFWRQERKKERKERFLPIVHVRVPEKKFDGRGICGSLRILALPSTIFFLSACILVLRRGHDIDAGRVGVCKITLVELNDSIDTHSVK